MPRSLPTELYHGTDVAKAMAISDTGLRDPQGYDSWLTSDLEEAKIYARRTSGIGMGHFRNDQYAVVVIDPTNVQLQDFQKTKYTVKEISPNAVLRVEIFDGKTGERVKQAKRHEGTTMDRYTPTNEESLTTLADGLHIMEGVVESSNLPEMWVYGLVKPTSWLHDSAKRSLQAMQDEEEQPNVAVVDMAVAFPVSYDTLYYFLGSGIILGSHDQFAYTTGGGEGVRTSPFYERTMKVTAGEFRELMLADSDGWLSDFLQQHGQVAAAPEEVKRTEPATPTEPEPAPQPPAEPKQSSQKTAHVMVVADGTGLETDTDEQLEKMVADVENAPANAQFAIFHGEPGSEYVIMITATAELEDAKSYVLSHGDPAEDFEIVTRQEMVSLIEDAVKQSGQV